MREQDWAIPSDFQPDPSDYGFDLDRALLSVVGLRAEVAEDAFTAATLGTERIGSGVAVRQPGSSATLVLTIGYLVTEAETLWLTSGDGRAVPAHALAVDTVSGFGLVQPLGRMDLPTLEPAPRGRPAPGETVILAAGGGRRHAIETQVTGRHDFAGYWEYLMEDAIFTAPAHPMWGGGALIGADGMLLGIGSLILQQQDEAGHRLDMNMVVPTSGIRPIIDELLTIGRRAGPPRPWLGVFVTEQGDAMVVSWLAVGGPAALAGVREGDQVLGIAGTDVGDVGALWRRLWEAGPAGTVVTLSLLRGTRSLRIAVTTGDRLQFLKAPRLH